MEKIKGWWDRNLSGGVWIVALGVIAAGVLMALLIIGTILGKDWGLQRKGMGL